MPVNQLMAIDWGNTNTVVIFKLDGTIAFLTSEANPIIPSYVQYDPEGRVVQIGWGAKNALRAGQGYVVMGTKRLLGRAWDPILAAHVKRVYGLETRRGAGGEILIQVGPGLELSAQQIARDFFSALREMIVKHYPEEMLPSCMATCPVHYLDPHKRELLQIFQQAKFSIWQERLLPEPQAVCLLFPPPKDGATLVIDWGGGTLDLALVSAQGKCLQLEGVQYGCGGSDMDIAIFHALEKSNRIPSLGGLDRAVLREGIEARKERLLALAQAQPLPPDRVQLPVCEEEVELNFHQAELLQWIEPILVRATNAIRTSYWSHRKELHQCILVGGPLQSPWIARRVQQALPQGCQLLQLPGGILQTTAVARGALEAYRGYQSTLVHDYGVAVDFFDHLMGRVLLQRGQVCPVDSPKEILRPRGTPGTWVDVVVFVREADPSTYKYVYHTSERFRILPRFNNHEAELEVQLIADSKGIVSLTIMDRHAHQQLHLQNVGQQMTSRLCGPPYRSPQEGLGGLLRHQWKKYLLEILSDPSAEDAFSPSRIQDFLQKVEKSPSYRDLRRQTQKLGKFFQAWIDEYINTIPPSMQPARSTLGAHLLELDQPLGSDEFRDLFKHFFQNLCDIFALCVQCLGTSKVLSKLRDWSKGQQVDLSFPIRRLEQIFQHFTGTEAEYRTLLNLWAELQPQLPPEIKDSFSPIHKLVHIRYKLYQLKEEIDQLQILRRSSS